jgi:cysteine synthase A
MKSILDSIGNTPLLEIESGIYAKAEFLNPSGSIKSRMAKHIIDEAEASGDLQKGDIIVEATSGNTGNAFSMVAAVKGYKMLVLMPDGYTNERVQISQGFGAEVRLVGHFQVNEARNEAIRLGRQEGYFCPQQFDNEMNVDENRDWLGREAVDQLAEQNVKIDAIVQGVGTGGTLIGLAQAIKQWHNPDAKIFAMEPTESQTLGSCLVADHKIEGISDGFVPTIYERHKRLVDDIIAIDSDKAIEAAKELTQEKGLFVGPSSGANLLAARQIKKDHPNVKNVLTLLCDKGEKYLTMMYK